MFERFNNAKLNKKDNFIEYNIATITQKAINYNNNILYTNFLGHKIQAVLKSYIAKVIKHCKNINLNSSSEKSLFSFISILIKQSLEAAAVEDNHSSLELYLFASKIIIKNRKDPDFLKLFCQPVLMPLILCLMKYHQYEIINSLMDLNINYSFDYLKPSFKVLSNCTNKISKELSNITNIYKHSKKLLGTSLYGQSSLPLLFNGTLQVLNVLLKQGRLDACIKIASTLQYSLKNRFIDGDEILGHINQFIHALKEIDNLNNCPLNISRLPPIKIQLDKYYSIFHIKPVLNIFLNYSKAKAKNKITDNNFNNAKHLDLFNFFIKLIIPSKKSINNNPPPTNNNLIQITSPNGLTYFVNRNELIKLSKENNSVELKSNNEKPSLDGPKKTLTNIEKDAKLKINKEKQIAHQTRQLKDIELAKQRKKNKKNQVIAQAKKVSEKKANKKLINKAKKKAKYLEKRNKEKLVQQQKQILVEKNAVQQAKELAEQQAKKLAAQQAKEISIKPLKKQKNNTSISESKNPNNTPLTFFNQSATPKRLLKENNHNLKEFKDSSIKSFDKNFVIPGYKISKSLKYLSDLIKNKYGSSLILTGGAVSTIYNNSRINKNNIIKINDYDCLIATSNLDDVVNFLNQYGYNKCSIIGKTKPILIMQLKDDNGKPMLIELIPFIINNKQNIFNFLLKDASKRDMVNTTFHVPLEQNINNNYPIIDTLNNYIYIENNIIELNATLNNNILFSSNRAKDLFIDDPLRILRLAKTLIEKDGLNFTRGRLVHHFISKFQNTNYHQSIWHDYLYQTHDNLKNSQLFTKLNTIFKRYPIDKVFKIFNELHLFENLFLLFGNDKIMCQNIAITAINNSSKSSQSLPLFYFI